LKCQFCTFFSIKLRKFWHTARLSRTNRHKVIKSEKQSGFLAHPVYLLTNYTHILLRPVAICSCVYCTVYLAVLRPLTVTMHLNGENNSPSLPFTLGGSGPHLIHVHGFLCPPESQPNLCLNPISHFCRALDGVQQSDRQIMPYR